MVRQHPWQMRNILKVILILAFLGFSHQTRGADKTLAQLDGRFGSTIQPFLQTYCVTCHGGEKPKAELDLSAYSSLAAVEKDARRWDLIIERLKAEEMPPRKAKSFPSPKARREAIAWFQVLRDYEAKRNAGDPG